MNSPEDWLNDHGAALYHYALRHTRDAHRAEEAVQETLLAALQARERYQAVASVRTWLIGILKHKILDQFRHDARETTLDEPEIIESFDFDDCFDATGHWAQPVADWGDPESQLARNQFMNLLQRCIDALPERLGRLFYLREVLEEDSETICQDFSITPTNLWTMLYRARMGLRRCLDSHQAGRAAWGT